MSPSLLTPIVFGFAQWNSLFVQELASDIVTTALNTRADVPGHPASLSNRQLGALGGCPFIYLVESRLTVILQGRNAMAVLE